VANPIDSARAFAKARSAELPPAHEDQEWLSNIEHRRDGNVRLTRSRFEEWISDAYLAGFIAKSSAGSTLTALAKRAHGHTQRAGIPTSIIGEAALWVAFAAFAGVALLLPDVRNATALAGLSALAAVGIRATRR
jgi:hypothetical protein